ncbi:MAG: phosphoribosylglycinamide formyltransferase [Burkholderiales bacterium]|nr:phosphoribosylglycinamide formyltransferase [Burkholderiales bacterium]
MLKIVVLVSGGGTNLQAIIDAISNHILDAKIESVIADRECYGLERARLAGIPEYLVDRKVEKQNLCTKVDELISPDCDLIVLAGFLSILDSGFIAAWQGKIINIHPSLLPKFGGSGMWGMNVHRAVVAAGEIKSGCTVHYVVDEIDGGDIILQTEVPVLASDKPEDVQKRVLSVEHSTLVAAIKNLIK